MGKSLAATTKIHNLAKNLRHSKHAKAAQRFGEGKKVKKMEGTTSIAQNSNSGGSSSSTPTTTTRLPLSEVVSDCVKRWFKDTLKEAKAGDINMQVLVGQMYYSGYGIPTDVQKGRAWITRASRTRSSVWKVSDKRPGYNASDSDSDEMKAE